MSQVVFFVEGKLAEAQKRSRAHARTHARTHARAYVRTYVRTYVGTHARTHVCTYLRTYVRTRARTYVRTRQAYGARCARSVSWAPVMETVHISKGLTETVGNRHGNRSGMLCISNGFTETGLYVNEYELAI